MRSLHAINPLRLAFISRGSDLRDRRVLDVGCGAGLLSEALVRLGAHVTGIDLAPDLINAARVHAGEQGLPVRYHRLSVEDLAGQQSGIFDVVVCMEVLEHIPHPQSVVTACSRMLRPGGDAYFSTIDRTAKSFLFAILGAEYVLGLLPRGSHRYGHLIRPVELWDWAARCGLGHRRHASISFNPLTRRFTLVDGLDVNYLAHFCRS